MHKILIDIDVTDDVDMIIIVSSFLRRMSFGCAFGFSANLNLTYDKEKLQSSRFSLYNDVHYF